MRVFECELPRVGLNSLIKYSPFLQGFRGCHRADVHPEHVHSLCRPGALRMCHLCEDITRAGGGILHITPWPLKRLTNDASLSSREQNKKTKNKTPSPNEIILTFCVSCIFFPRKNLSFTADFSRLSLENEAYYVPFPFTIQQCPHTIERLIRKQRKHPDARVLCVLV